MHRTLACAATGLALLAASAFASAADKSLTICADPGNMPLSNERGEGFENKIAQQIGQAIGAGIQYYWRPSIERGLMRTTLSDGNCDVWMDMAADTEGAVITVPLYRSTFVLVSRSDRHYDFKSLDDPRLQTLRIGVFQVSAMRQALAAHGIMNNTVIHYLSHNGDMVAENQPSYQVQEVIDGKLDVAAVWGPMAGWYKAARGAPISVQPANTIDSTVPLEFDMALAVPRGRPEIKAAVERALHERRDAIHQILDDYGVPLVKCADCVVSGNLPSHGPYKDLPPSQVAAASAARDQGKALASLKDALAHGADPGEELANAITAGDGARVDYLLAHGAGLEARFNDGSTPLTMAARERQPRLVDALLARHADVNATDGGGWTALMHAAWSDDAGMVKALVAHGARTDVADPEKRTALSVAAQNGKRKATDALLAAGADVEHPAGAGGYTPLMLATSAGEPDIADALLQHGAKVDAANGGGVTALMIAAASNQTRIAQLLLEHHADANAKAADGRSALSIAQANNAEALTRLLRGEKLPASDSAKGGAQRG